MSYCRFLEGDVYIFLASDEKKLECCGCILQEREWVKDENSPLKGYLRDVGELIQNRFDTTQGMLDHLEIHKNKGHYVPDFCIEGLLRDKEENDKLMLAPCGHNYNVFDNTVCAKPGCPWSATEINE